MSYVDKPLGEALHIFSEPGVKPSYHFACNKMDSQGAKNSVAFAPAELYAASLRARACVSTDDTVIPIRIYTTRSLGARECVIRRSNAAVMPSHVDNLVEWLIDNPTEYTELECMHHGQACKNIPRNNRPLNEVPLKLAQWYKEQQDAFNAFALLNASSVFGFTDEAGVDRYIPHTVTVTTDTVPLNILVMHDSFGDGYLRVTIKNTDAGDVIRAELIDVDLIHITMKTKHGLVVQKWRPSHALRAMAFMHSTSHK